MKRKFIILIAAISLVAIWLILFCLCVHEVWGYKKNETQFHELSDETQAAIASSIDLNFSSDDCIESIQYIDYKNGVEEIIIKIKTKNTDEFIDNNPNLSNNFIQINSSEIPTGDTGYYSEGNALYIAIQNLVYVKNEYLRNLVKSILPVFEDI